MPAVEQIFDLQVGFVFGLRVIVLSTYKSNSIHYSGYHIYITQYAFFVFWICSLLQFFFVLLDFVSTKFCNLELRLDKTPICKVEKWWKMVVKKKWNLNAYFGERKKNCIQMNKCIRKNDIFLCFILTLAALVSWFFWVP